MLVYNLKKSVTPQILFHLDVLFYQLKPKRAEKNKIITLTLMPSISNKHEKGKNSTAERGTIDWW